MTQETPQGMRELIDRINRASYAYYVLDNPEISDYQWDQLYDRLKKMEQETGVVLPDSPTRQVGGETLPGFEEHRHLNRLWSMDKVQSIGELEAWIRRTEKLAGQTDLQYYLEYKFDGLTINLTYREGQLVQAATRGNGTVGEAILPQAMTILSIPRRIPYRGILEVQGECIMRLSTLEKYNRTAREPLKNARNAAAGALRNLDPAVTASRHLDAFFYQIGTIENPPYEDQPGMLAFLKENGFQISPYLGRGKGLAELEREINRIGEIRPTLDWLIDGVVIKIGDTAIRRELGFTEKFPRWAVAYKFKAEEGVTRLERVTWELGRTGKLTPLAHLAPIDFYGVTVRKATLNNLGDIRRKDLAVGCNVWIRRSNDVIPEILGRAGEAEPGETPIEEPAVCPACGRPVVRRGAHLFCMNRETCRPQAVARLSHFASREAMDIEGFSEKTADQLYDSLGIRQPADLYQLTEEKLQSLDGFQQKKAANLIAALEKSKRRPLPAFLYALGIPNIGVKTARDLAEAFGSVEGLAKAGEEELTRIPDIGEIVTQSIREYFSFPENLEMIRQLTEAGVQPEKAETRSGSAFAGMSIVVTGTLPTLSRKEAEDLIRREGGTAAGSVSKKTAFVVAGENAGSKLTKAQSLGIEIIGEEELLRRAADG
ncbi:MAG: NAD-dependent DNA ligase LigA [Clostridiales bacterium]|nr:NAD-dependent DNA ligase LigA [Clostridiales bacterium]